MAENKKQEIESDLKKSLSEVAGESDNKPIAVMKKDRYKIWNPHKQFPNMVAVGLYDGSIAVFNIVK